VRLYRVTKNNPPTVYDMQSHWDRGFQPPRPQDEAAYKEVSVFESPEAAAQKARDRKLGDYIAELEVPESAVGSRNPASGHIGLKDTTPDQLLGCIQSIVLVADV
jgi:hypothetical protein